MPDFSELFKESKMQPIEYKGQKVISIDKFPVKNGDELIVSIERTNSDCRQGFCIDITGHCEIDGQVFKQGKGIRMLLWQDTTSKPVKLKIFTKKDFVWVQNIWEKTSSYQLATPSGETITKESKAVDYGHFGSAMIAEEIENGRRYRCNDWHPDDNFDDIVFTVQKHL